jgi:fluoroquinolone transport system permease protein
MRRLAATIAADVRLQFRNGFYFATAFVVVFSVLLLRWLPADAAMLMLPVVMLGNVLTNSFYFMSGLLLMERGEGTFVVQSITPLRDDEYLLSKTVTLTALSLIESLTIAAAVFGAGTWLVTMAAGVFLAAVLFCLVAVAVVVRYDSINEFLMPSVPVTCFLLLPVLGVLGVGPTAWYSLHPLRGALLLMQLDAPHTAAWLAYGVGYPLIWFGPAYYWSRRSLDRARNA